MPYVPDAKELRQQAYEENLLKQAKVISLVSLVITAAILVVA